MWSDGALLGLREATGGSGNEKAGRERGGEGRNRYLRAAAVGPFSGRRVDDYCSLGAEKEKRMIRFVSHESQFSIV
jgi:hypothetical protein